MIIEPYGGKLIDLYVAPDEREDILSNSDFFKKIYLNSKQETDLFLIASGAYSPLDSFMNSSTYYSVIEKENLPNYLPWTIPINLTVEDRISHSLNVKDEVLLINRENYPLALLKIEEKYGINKSKEAREVYGTTDLKHPGVNYLFNSGTVSLSGRIKYLNKNQGRFNQYYISPIQLRNIIIKNGWKTVAGFQTRNPLHRGHEYLHKNVLNEVDGLIIHPLVGETAVDEIPSEVRIATYKTLIEKYYPTDRCIFSVYTGYMRYAGPKEAIFHAIVRRNYGCSHFIIGRDHAGINNFYNKEDSIRIFEGIDLSKLGIIPIFFEEAFYCNGCKRIITEKDCIHPESERIIFSGTNLRSYLRRGIMPPTELMRTEVSAIILEYYEKKNKVVA